MLRIFTGFPYFAMLVRGGRPSVLVTKNPVVVHKFSFGMMNFFKRRHL